MIQISLHARKDHISDFKLVAKQLEKSGICLLYLGKQDCRLLAKRDEHSGYCDFSVIFKDMYAQSSEDFSIDDIIIQIKNEIILKIAKVIENEDQGWYFSIDKDSTKLTITGKSFDYTEEIDLLILSESPFKEPNKDQAIAKCCLDADQVIDIMTAHVRLASSSFSRILDLGTTVSLGETEIVLKTTNGRVTIVTRIKTQKQKRVNYTYKISVQKRYSLLERLAKPNEKVEIYFFNQFAVIFSNNVEIFILLSSSANSMNQREINDSMLSESFKVNCTILREALGQSIKIPFGHFDSSTIKIDFHGQGVDLEYQTASCIIKKKIKKETGLEKGVTLSTIQDVADILHKTLPSKSNKDLECYIMHGDQNFGKLKYNDFLDIYFALIK